MPALASVWCYWFSAWPGVSALWLAGVWCYWFSAWPGVSALWLVSGVIGSVPGLASVHCGWCLVLLVQCLAWRQCTVAGVWCYWFSAWPGVSALWLVSGVSCSVPGLASVYSETRTGSTSGLASVYCDWQVSGVIGSASGLAVLASVDCVVG